VDVEQYSIDEAFIFLPTTATTDYSAYGKCAVDIVLGKV
jgi:hypothetical protein